MNYLRLLEIQNYINKNENDNQFYTLKSTYPSENDNHFYT